MESKNAIIVQSESESESERGQRHFSFRRRLTLPTHCLTTVSHIILSMETYRNYIHGR